MEVVVVVVVVRSGCRNGISGSSDSSGGKKW